MPSTGEGLHKFQFSTARLDKVETHGKLECLHQALLERKQSLVGHTCACAQQIILWDIITMGIYMYICTHYHNIVRAWREVRGKRG